MARRLARVARWSLPAALLVATLVAASGLGALLFTRPAAPAPAPALALNLSSAPALPADDATLTPQQLPVVAASARVCPGGSPPACPGGGGLRAGQPGCCR